MNLADATNSTGNPGEAPYALTVWQTIEFREDIESKAANRTSMLFL